jgi:hypothetical protein
MNYSLESLKEIDRFIDDNVIEGELRKDGYLEKILRKRFFQ